MHNLGIIGFGGVANWHTETLKSLSDRIRVKGVYDINPDKIKNAEAKGLTGYASAEELLSDSEIDIVLVSTPNNFHKEYCLLALNAGKNVICEKPVTLSVADFDDICNTAEKSGKIFTVHQNRRWDRDFRIVKEVYDKNIIGKPFYIESRVQGANGVPGDWRLTEVAGGGMVWDWGVHLLDQMLWMIDSPVVSVYADLMKIKSEEVDDNFRAILRFENGISAVVEVDTYCFIPLPKWHMSGENGTMVINDWNCSGEIVRANLLEMKYETGIVYTGSGPTRTLAPRPVESIEKLQLPQNVDSDVLNLMRNFMDVIEGKADRIIQLYQVRRVLEVIEKIFESSDSGKSVECNI